MTERRDPQPWLILGCTGPASRRWERRQERLHSRSSVFNFSAARYSRIFTGSNPAGISQPVRAGVSRNPPAPTTPVEGFLPGLAAPARQSLLCLCRLVHRELSAVFILPYLARLPLQSSFCRWPVSSPLG